MDYETSGEAYDASQCELQTGTVMHIPSEKVIGIADTWPMAVTIEIGKLHGIAQGYSLERFMRNVGFMAGDVQEAVALADLMGYPVEEWARTVANGFHKCEHRKPYRYCCSNPTCPNHIGNFT